MVSPAEQLSNASSRRITNAPEWAVEVVQVSALLGFAAHAYVWWRAYQNAGAPTPENWIDPRMILVPFLLGIPVLYSAFRRSTWACLVLLGATWVGLVGAITWLAGALSGENVLGVSSLDGALDRTAFFLVPALVAIPFTAACARLGMLSVGSKRS